MEDNDKKVSPPKKGTAFVILVLTVVVLCGITLLLTYRTDPETASETQTPSASVSAEDATPQPSAPQSSGTSFMDSEQWGLEPGETEVSDYADTSYLFDPSIKYRNDKQLIYQYNDQGDTITVGVGRNINASRLYLNPVASITEQGKKVGYYISVSPGAVLTGEMVYADKAAEQNQGHSNFIIYETYDSLIPAEYTNENDYGAAWAAELGDGITHPDAVFQVRAIDLSSGDMLASFRVTASYDAATQSYSLRSIQSSDVLTTGEMSAGDRDALLDHAIDLAAHPDLSPYQSAAYALFTHDDSIRETIKSKSIVEYLGNSTYFYKLYTSEQQPIPQRRFLGICESDIVAVNLYIPTEDNLAPGGLLTLYYAPDGFGVIDAERYAETDYLDPDQSSVSDDLLMTIRPVTNDPVTSLGLVFAGYDYYAPFSRQWSDGFFE